MTTFMLIAALLLFFGLLYWGKGYWAWVLGGAAALIGWWLSEVESETLFRLAAVLGLVLAVIFGLPALRRGVISNMLMGFAAKAMPGMGETERIALDAGTVWWDGDLFSGRPDWDKLLAFRPKPLSDAEQAFLDGPVEEAAAMMDDWEISQTRDLPENVWAFLKKNRFFGMIIPEEYGGLGFSAYAHSQVVTKLSSRSSTAAVVVMVPNSLGPAELILHYGTQDQKDHYLPRLATGEEMPCFALTEPTTGSDAAATRSTGVVCKGQFEGKEVLGLRLNWAKRYITLSSVATVVGLAFRCLDPDGLLGGAEDRGITCALIPAGLPGIDIGQRHDPMGIPFPNGPVFGRDVFVPLDFVIGGE
ncbi:MAG: acyl-CoA dehydrogenase family protein, partial [Rhodospirillales bacterium]|nr:acyl-CoA dehydrogenase family protein [Rhodospirillales bacterium]